MTTVNQLFCFQCPIRDHCPHRAFLESWRLANPGFTASLPKEKQAELFTSDINKIKETIKNCPLLKIMRSSRARVTSPETHPEWPEFLKEIGYTAEQYAILDENSKKGLRDSFRKRIS